MLSSGCVPHGWLCVLWLPFSLFQLRTRVSGWTFLLCSKQVDYPQSFSQTPIFFFHFKHSEGFQKVNATGFTGVQLVGKKRYAKDVQRKLSKSC